MLIPSFGISLRSWRTAHRLLTLLLIVSGYDTDTPKIIGTIFLLSRDGLELAGSLSKALLQVIGEFQSREEIAHAETEAHFQPSYAGIAI